MKIRLEAVTNVEQEAAAARVRREVFGTEWVGELCRISPNNSTRASQLIARVLPEGDVVASVTVLDTTGDQTLHDKYELPFGRFDRVARYTHMAVLKEYRGLNLPLYLLLEARQFYIIPNRFAYTWLLFPADGAMSSSFCSMLRFSASPRVVNAEQGRCRVLLRNEKCHEADAADAQTKWFLTSMEPKPLQVVSSSESDTAVESSDKFSRAFEWRHHFGLVREDEWVAH